MSTIFQASSRPSSCVYYGTEDEALKRISEYLPECALEKPENAERFTKALCVQLWQSGISFRSICASDREMLAIKIQALSESNSPSFLTDLQALILGHFSPTRISDLLFHLEETCLLHLSDLAEDKEETLNLLKSSEKSLIDHYSVIPFVLSAEKKEIFSRAIHSIGRNLVDFLYDFESVRMAKAFHKNEFGFQHDRIINEKIVKIYERVCQIFYQFDSFEKPLTREENYRFTTLVASKEVEADLKAWTRRKERKPSQILTTALKPSVKEDKLTPKRPFGEISKPWKPYLQ